MDGLRKNVMHDDWPPAPASEATGDRRGEPLGKRAPALVPASKVERQRPRLSRQRICCVLLILGVGGVQSGHAQRDGAGSGGEMVFLDADTAASKKLGAARDLLTARQWSDGIDLIRQIAEQHGDRLVGIAPGRYVGVRTYCDILLSVMPEEGLKLYRARTDPQAKRWFEAAQKSRDVEGLQTILRRAYLSSFGDDALLLLGQLTWEQGQIAQARGYWEQLLPLIADGDAGQLPPVLRYPASNIEPAHIRARLVLCSVFQGQLDRGKRELAAFRRLHPTATGTIGGRQGNLAEILAAHLEQVEQGLPSASDSLVPTFAGNPQRNLVQPHAVDVGSAQWSAPLTPVRVPRPPRPEDVFERQFAGDRADRGPLAAPQNLLCYYPAVSDNLVLYCDETAVYARELLSAIGGGPAWGEQAAIYRLPPEPARTGVEPPRRVGLPAFSVSVDENRLFATLGSSWTGARSRLPTAPKRSLVCLDLKRQGDLVWSRNADEVDPERGGWTFDGAPLAGDGHVFVALRRREPQLQLNVACFEADSGKLRWNRKVCLGLDPFGPEIEEAHHQLLTLADGRLYYGTNQGAVTALDARDGTIAWVATYQRAEAETAVAFNRRQQSGPNPCVAAEGLVFVAPFDSDRILAYDGESGVLLWSRELKGNVRQLVGVDKGRLIAAGDHLWGLEAETGKIDWFTGTTDPGAATRGRGALAGGLVYWPRREEIVLVESETGRIRRQIDLSRQHDLPGGGNIVLAEGCLLLAQTDRLVAFNEFGSLRKQKQENVAQRRDDPRPLWELGLVAEAARDWDAALAAYRQAAERVGFVPVGDQQPLQRRLALRSARLLQQRAEMALAAGNRDDAVVDLRNAAEVAAEFDVKAEFTSALARAEEEGGAPTSAVAAWQKVLTRGPAPDEADDLQRVSIRRRARDQIARLIKAHGRGIYAEVESVATQAFAEPLQDRDLPRVAQLLVQFPNAEIAAATALQLAETLASSGELYQSDRIYRELLESDDSSPVVPLALTGLASNAEARRAWRSAYRWWQRLYEQHGDAHVNIDGFSRRVREAVPARLNQLFHARPAIPADFDPWLRSWTVPIEARSQALVPVGNSPSAEHDCVLLAGQTVRCLDADSGLVRWEVALPEAADWAGFVADVLVLTTRASAFGLAPDTGQMFWHRSFPRPAGTVAATRCQVADDRLICLDGAQRIWSLLPETGIAAWRYELPHGELQPDFYCSGDRLVLQQLRPNRWQVLRISNGTLMAEGPGPDVPWKSDPILLESGRFLAMLDGSRPPSIVETGVSSEPRRCLGAFSTANSLPELLSGDKALLAVIDGDTLARFDMATGERLWSCRAGTAIVRQLRSSTCVDARHVYIAADGILRCVGLEDGRLVWEQYLGPRGNWHTERVGAWLAAWSSDTGAKGAVALLDPASGALVERLHVDGPAASLRFHMGNARALLVTDSRLVAFHRAPAVED